MKGERMSLENRCFPIINLVMVKIANNNNNNSTTTIKYALSVPFLNSLARDVLVLYICWMHLLVFKLLWHLDLPSARNLILHVLASPPPVQWPLHMPTTSWKLCGEHIRCRIRLFIRAEKSERNCKECVQ
jgi:hypothetical protein